MFDLKKIISAEPGFAPDAPEFLEDLFNSIPLGIFSVDEDLRITAVNDVALDALEIPRRRAIGKPCCDVFRGAACRDGCALRQTMESGESIVNLRTKIKDSLGRHVPVSLSTAVFRDKDGNVAGGVVTLQN